MEPGAEPDPAILSAARGVSASLRIGARGAPVLILVDGEAVTCFAGETVAAALIANGRRWLRSSPTAGAPRGAFCLMGACQECTIRVDGRLAPACMTGVRDGLVVECRGAWEPADERNRPDGLPAR